MDSDVKILDSLTISLKNTGLTLFIWNFNANRMFSWNWRFNPNILAAKLNLISSLNSLFYLLSLLAQVELQT